jgi:glyoxylase-like metal-dependent hydrolase (beta-lactamase superfamily II)
MTHAVFTADATLCSPAALVARPRLRTSLINDVKSRLFDVLPDDTRFYPGHGNDSTLGEQKPHIEEWRSRGW